MDRFKNTITTHSHISSLGTNNLGLPIDTPGSLIGQEDAREAASLIIDMVKQKKISGRGILFTGPSGSGKTALALAISKELGKKVPFTILSASEIFSSEVSKSEIIHEHARMSIKLRIKEVKDIFEGEVFELFVLEEECKFKKSKKIVKEINLTLKSNKGSKRVKLSPSLYNIIEKEKITVGDIVYIEASSGIIKRLGRSETFLNDTDIENEQYIPLPKGEVARKKEMVQDVTLHDLDIANSKPMQKNILSCIKEITNPKKTEITQKLRLDVNKIVIEYLDRGDCEIIPGILFIDEAYMLDNECFSFLTRIVESKFSPLLILSSNKIFDQNNKSILDMPKDFLERLLIINMKPNSIENIRKIVMARIKETKMKISNDSIDFLCANFNLRYIISILPILKVYKSNIEIDDVQEVTDMFFSKQNM